MLTYNFEENKGPLYKYLYECIKNDIKLIRIPYYDYDKLNEDYLNNLIKEKQYEKTNL